MASLGNAPPPPPREKDKTSSAAAMMLPLTMALAYLDAIAKTWLALGEKLSDSLSFYSTKTSSGFNYSSILRPTASARTSSRKPKTSTKHWSHRANPARADATSEPGACDHHERPQTERKHHRCSSRSFGKSSSSAHPRLHTDFLRSFLQSLVPNGRASTASTTSPSTTSPSTPSTDNSATLEPASTGSGTGTGLSNSWLRLGGSCSGSSSSSVNSTGGARTIQGGGGAFPKQASQQGGSPCGRHGLPPSKRARATDKTLVLDLDETLISARRSGDLAPDGRFDFMVVLPPRQQRAKQKLAEGLALCAGRDTGVASAADAPARFGGRGGSAARGGCGERRRIYVRKRPHLREFLEAASREFEVVLFTAAREEFANAVLEEIDPGRKMVDHVLARDSCTRLRVGGGSGRKAGGRKTAAVVKDLGILGRPLSKVSM